MGTRRWRIDLNERSHEVVLHHGYFSARRTLLVDGAPVLDLHPGPLEAVRLWNTATEHDFVLAGHPARIRIDPTIDNMTYKMQLIVDGKDVESAATVAPLPKSTSRGGEGPWMGGLSGLVVVPFAFLAFLIGEFASTTQHRPVWMGLGVGGAGLCWGAREIVGESWWRRALLGVAVDSLLFIATRLGG